MDEQIDDLTGLDMLIREYATYCAEHEAAKAKTADAKAHYETVGKISYGDVHREARDRIFLAAGKGERPSVDDLAVFRRHYDYSYRRAELAYEMAEAIEKVAYSKAALYQIELEAFLSQPGVSLSQLATPPAKESGTQCKTNNADLEPPPPPPLPPPNEPFKKGA